MKSVKEFQGKKVSNTVPRIQKYLYTVEAIADYIQTTPAYVYRLVYLKEIPHIKMSFKKILFDLKDVKKWLKTKKVAVRKKPLKVIAKDNTKSTKKLF